MHRDSLQALCAKAKAKAKAKTTKAKADSAKAKAKAKADSAKAKAKAKAYNIPEIAHSKIKTAHFRVELHNRKTPVSYTCTVRDKAITNKYKNTRYKNN